MCARATRSIAMLQSAAPAQQQRLFPRLTLRTHSTLPSRTIYRSVSVLQTSCKRSRAFQSAKTSSPKHLLGARAAAAADQQTASMAAEVDAKSDVPTQALVDLAVVWACQHGLVTISFQTDCNMLDHLATKGKPMPTEFWRGADVINSHSNRRALLPT